jgi:hypothetical protein
VHVDYDAELMELKFSQLDAHATPSMLSEFGGREISQDAYEAEMQFQQQTIERLAEQAKPAQMRLLSEYSSRVPLLRQISECPARALQGTALLELQRCIVEVACRDSIGCVAICNELFSVGAQVETHSLSATALNGARGTVKHHVGERVAVDFDKGDLKSIRPSNLIPVELLEMSQDALIQRLVSAAGGELPLMCFWAEVLGRRDGTPVPKCVCGGSLSRCSLFDRSLTFLRSDERYSSLSGEDLQRFAQSVRNNGGGIICDLCDEAPEPSSSMAGLWTCSNGSSTILHATSYDVCEECFQKCVTSPP